jgi:hypothetical protein
MASLLPQTARTARCGFGASSIKRLVTYYVIGNYKKRMCAYSKVYDP